MTSSAGEGKGQRLSLILKWWRGSKVTIGPCKASLKAGCAVGFVVIIVAGWSSGSYSIAAHRERYRQLYELRVRNRELSRDISEKKDHLAVLKRGEPPLEPRCTLPKLGPYRSIRLSRDGSGRLEDARGGAP
jgi:hypothetical protein